MSTDVFVDFRDAAFTYDGEAFVFRHLNLAVPQGQFLCLLGGNGSGKSTLAKHINALLLPGVAWLSYDASIMPAAVCGFAYGPAAGLACGIISVVAHGILFADFTGALMNLLVVIGFILPSALVYKKIHTLKGAIIGLVLGIVFAVIMAVLGNLVVTPAWLGVPLDAVVAMIVPILIPFNLLKGLLNAILTLIVYKAISNLITPKKDQVKGR